MKKLGLFLALLLVFGCTKVRIKKDYPELSGTYNWISSVDTLGNLFLNTNVSDSYRLVIKDNSRMLIYKNDNRFFKEYIKSIEKLSDTSYYLIAGKGFNEVRCTWYNNTLTSPDIPFPGYLNTFNK